jgi:hypothetical protein
MRVSTATTHDATACAELYAARFPLSAAGSLDAETTEHWVHQTSSRLLGCRGRGSGERLRGRGGGDGPGAPWVGPVAPERGPCDRARPPVRRTSPPRAGCREPAPRAHPPRDPSGLRRGRALGASRQHLGQAVLRRSRVAADPGGPVEGARGRQRHPLGTLDLSAGGPSCQLSVAPPC